MVKIIFVLLGMMGTLFLLPAQGSAQVSTSTSNPGGPATFYGITSYLAPSGSITSIAGQINLPQGLSFSSPATLSYTSQGSGNTFLLTGITLTPDTISVSPSVDTVNLQQAFNTNDLATALSIIQRVAATGGLE
jgi:hypothetical protein